MGEIRHKVFLFGSIGIREIPLGVEAHLRDIWQQTGGNVDFIVGDARGVDSAFHKSLSRIGAADNAEIYCMDTVRNNNYGLKVRAFKSCYNEQLRKVEIYDASGENIVDEVRDIDDIRDFKFTRAYYTVKDRQMIKDCTFGICVWDGKSKGTGRNVDTLRLRGKPVYVYTV